MFQLQNSWEPELILNDAVLDSGSFGLPIEFEGNFGTVRDRLLAIDVFAGCDGIRDCFGPAVRGLCIEVDRVRGIAEGLIQPRSPRYPPAFFRNSLQFDGA